MEKFQFDNTIQFDFRSFLEDHQNLTRQMVSDLYGISRHTFRRYCLKNNIELGSGIITPEKILSIFNRIGIPNKCSAYFKAKNE